MSDATLGGIVHVGDPATEADLGTHAVPEPMDGAMPSMPMPTLGSGDDDGTE